MQSYKIYCQYCGHRSDHPNEAFDHFNLCEVIMISRRIFYDEATCKRCDHTWNPITPTPRVCPRCKSYDWQKDRVRKGLVTESTSKSKES